MHLFVLCFCFFEILLLLTFFHCFSCISNQILPLSTESAALDKMGASMEVARYTERLTPSTRFVTYGGHTPSAPLSFVSPAATLVGDIKLGESCSVWYGAVVRGDVNSVRVGTNTSICENAVVHVAKIQGDFDTNIGNNVTVGPGAIVHAATLGSNIVVGARAQVR